MGGRSFRSPFYFYFTLGDLYSFTTFKDDLFGRTVNVVSQKNKDRISKRFGLKWQHIQ